MPSIPFFLPRLRVFLRHIGKTRSHIFNLKLFFIRCCVCLCLLAAINQIYCRKIAKSPSGRWPSVLILKKKKTSSRSWSGRPFEENTHLVRPIKCQGSYRHHIESWHLTQLKLALNCGQNISFYTIRLYNPMDYFGQTKINGAQLLSRLL